MDLTKVVRCETPVLEELALAPGSVKVDEKSGDVTFGAIALDTKKTFNRRGFTFKWASPNDVDVSSLQANGRLYFMHDTWEIGVGFITQVKVTKTQVLIKGLIPGDSRFSEEVQDSDMVKKIREVREAVRTGLVKAVSIGFYITGYEEVMDAKNPDRVAGLRVTKLEIIEASIVTIGAHETALIQSVPGVTCEDDITWAEEQFTEVGGHELASNPEMIPEPDVLKYARQGEMITMGMEGTPPEHPTTITVEEVLAMAEIEEEIQTEQSIGDRTGQSVDDSLNEVIKHHSNTAPYSVIKDKLLQGMAKILGARGGVQGLSDEARAHAYAHFAAHYAEMEVEPPALGSYSKDELMGFHEAGRIQIPGANKSVASIEVDVVASPEIQSFLKIVEKFGGDVSKLEVAVTKLSERMGIVTPDLTEQDPAPSESGNIDLSALRQQVRQALQSDPEVRELSKAHAVAFVESQRAKNRERSRNARRS
jgi:hypothetical protein